MARSANHSALDVESTVKELKAQNKQVTPYRVQKMLGGGSFAWVKSTLDLLGYGDNFGVPDSIDPDTSELIRLVQPLVDRLHQTARLDLDKVVDEKSTVIAASEAKQKELSQAIQELELQLRNEKSRNMVLVQTNGELQSLLKEEEKAHKMTRSALNIAQGDIKILAAQRQEAEKLADSQRANLQVFREATKDQLDALKQAHRTESQSLHSQLNEFRSQLQHSRTELVKLNRENAELLKSKVQAQNELQTTRCELTAAEIMIKDLSAYRNVYTAALSRLESSLEHERKERKIITERHTTLTQTLSEEQQSAHRYRVQVEQLIATLPEKRKKEQVRLINLLT